MPTDQTMAADHHCRQGDAYRQARQWAEAQRCYEQALQLQPSHAQACFGLGSLYLSQGRWAEAAAWFREVIRLRPDVAAAYCNLGNALAGQGRFEEAAAAFTAALQLQPGSADLLRRRRTVLDQLGRLAEAEADARALLDLRPGDAAAHAALADLLRRQGRWADALAECDAAIRLQPDLADAHGTRALVWLTLGDYERGWPEYEWRWRCADFAQAAVPRPRWDGSPLRGQAVLLQAEQGLGDTLQFIRYAPLVQERGGVVIAAVPPALRRLLQSCRGIDRLVNLGEPVVCALWAPHLSLPGIFQTTVATVPADVPYLAAEEALVEAWRQVLGPYRGLTIGVAWQGSTGFRGDHLRSFPLARLAPLAALPGVRLVSLQKGPGSDQVGTVDFPILDLGPRLDESSGAFVDTAAVLRSLDLLVTVDTALAHLAGALAVPTWVALPYVPNWRWLLDRDDSPWYPTARLFRQPRPGDWEAVFVRMADELRRRLRP
ncbi:MAG: tetratricopeptide repeat protein [Gemmataceae bacterium]|nr:tetratricopeptide repeat protein [Gemmataceae bacterium]MDW8266550.1 tetratricopeptide repeat protein [Gemmataceae bacterium]